MATPNIPGLMLDYAHPLSRGLAGWWPMNEGGGERVNDISGNGNNGILTNGGKFQGNKRGGGIYLDGSDDYVIIPDSNSLSIAGDLTLSYWISCAFANYSMPICKGSSAIAAPYYSYVYPGGGAFLLGRGNGAVENGVSVSIQIPLDVLTHIALTMTGTGVVFYMNGAKVGSNTLSATIADAGGPLYFGRRADGYYTKMLASHFRIYNRALSIAEVAQIYADPLVGALAPSRLTRLYTVPVASPPAAATGPLSSDRLYNRSLSRIWRRGETG